MKLYRFTRLIKKYSVNFEILQNYGKYINGHWQNKKTEKKEGTGAIVPIDEKKIYQSGGSYGTKDKRLYTFEPINNPLENTKIVYKNDVYSVEQETDYSDYSDVFVYLLKYVSVFNEKGGGNID